MSRSSKKGPYVDEKLYKRVEKLGLQHKVKIEQQKYSTINLSTGQRKRLALITAYL